MTNVISSDKPLFLTIRSAVSPGIRFLHPVPVRGFLVNGFPFSSHTDNQPPRTRTPLVLSTATFSRHGV